MFAKLEVLLAPVPDTIFIRAMKAQVLHCDYTASKPGPIHVRVFLSSSKGFVKAGRVRRHLAAQAFALKQNACLSPYSEGLPTERQQIAEPMD